MTAPTVAARRRGASAIYAGNARSVMLRGWRATASTNWLVMLSGFFEPIFYLLSMASVLARSSATWKARAGTRSRMRLSSLPRFSPSRR